MCLSAYRLLWFFSLVDVVIKCLALHHLCNLKFSIELFPPYSVSVKEYSSLCLNFYDAKFSAFEDFLHRDREQISYLELRRLFRKARASPKDWTGLSSFYRGLLGYSNVQFNGHYHQTSVVLWAFYVNDRLTQAFLFPQLPLIHRWKSGGEISLQWWEKVNHTCEMSEERFPRYFSVMRAPYWTLLKWKVKGKWVEKPVHVETFPLHVDRVKGERDVWMMLWGRDIVTRLSFDMSHVAAVK